MNDIIPSTLIIRAGRNSLSFLKSQEGAEPVFYPYNIKNEMSVAANLREAFRDMPELRHNINRAQLLVTSPVILVPSEEYHASDSFNSESLWLEVMTGHQGEMRVTREIDSLNCVGIFSVNKDLNMVVGDNCQQVELQNIMIPTWQHLYASYYEQGNPRQLFAYFHDRMVDICSFEKNRIRFANTFEATHAHDALYYILCVWRQLGMSQTEDKLHIIGDIPQKTWLNSRLASYITNIQDSYDNKGLPDFANSKELPLDLILCA